MKNRSLANVAALAALALLKSSASVDAAVAFNLSCQPPTRNVRVMHLQDVSPDVAEYTKQGLLGGAITLFDAWLDETFQDGYTQGIYRYSDKRVLAGDVSFCADLFAPLSYGPIESKYKTLPLESGLDVSLRSVNDVLWRLTNLNWDKLLKVGKRVAIVYAGALPRSAVPSQIPILPFDKTDNCEVVDYPGMPRLVDALYRAFISVIFVVPLPLVETYKMLFSTDAVVPLSTIPDAQYEALFNAFNNVYCSVPIPITAPVGDVPPVETFPPVPTFQPPICANEAILQLLHIQDISYSYTNDFQNMLRKFPLLIQNLSNKFFTTELALASFSDKPIGNSGYPGDYCYREDHFFTTDADSFFAALNGLKILSGRDWRESQYDALYFGSISRTLGWKFPYVTTKDNNRVVRVAMVATDSGPHVAGDLGDLTPQGGPTCFERDYLSPEELGAQLIESEVHPIFIVTDDIYNYWLRKAALVSPNAKVLRLGDDPVVMFQAIEAHLEELCRNQQAN